MMESTSRWWSRTGDKASGFAYWDSRGRPITSPAALTRIASLGIPPAWRDVRISPSAAAKLQAVGVDQKGRKQYRYHPDWTREQAAVKFHRLADFARRLPQFRAVTSRHLAEPELCRDKVLALVCRLLSEGRFRVGGERYARENHSYGIATLRRHHLSISAGCLVFAYRGKHGVKQSQVVCDEALAELMRELAALPGARLFKYPAGDGSHVPLSSRDVNAYLKEIMGDAFSAKDFRTWSGTLLAAQLLASYGPASGERELKQNLVRCVKEVAKALGNTPAIAKSSYIAPAVFESYRRGITLEKLVPTGRRRLTLLQQGYLLEEVALMRMLDMEPEREGAALRVSMLPEPAPERVRA